MPTLTSPSSKVLVTGPNGYVGSWVVKTLLDRGYSVRAVVRSEARANELKGIFPSAGSKLESVVVPDMLEEGAFDEVVRDVDAIVHTASPLAGKGQTYEDYIRPAVDGTLGIFKSALKNGSNVKRIVTTSSIAAIAALWNRGSQEAETYTEEDWNDGDVAWVNDGSKEFNHIAGYAASKTLAEKAAWDFYNAHKQEVGWDITFLQPSMIFGPYLQTFLSPAESTGTQRVWWDSVMGGGPKTRELLEQGSSWVDVRDVAEAHVRSLEKEEAGNERILVSAESYVWQEWLDIANLKLPEVAPSSKYELSKGFKDIENKVPVAFDTSKEKRILGCVHRTKEETTKDFLAYAVKQGWL